MRSRYMLPSLLLLFVMILATRCVQAQPGGLPFGPVNAGKEFYLAFPANWDIPTGVRYYIRLYITSSVKTTVKISKGNTLLKTMETKPYDIITCDLPPPAAQMFTRNDTDPVPEDRIYRNGAIRIEADEPVVVYGINRTSFTSDGMLALPVNALGDTYIVASYAAVIGVSQELPSQYMVIAPHDSTMVTITQPMDSKTHGDTAYSLMMHKGDVYSAMSVGANGDMSGTVITADKPVAVVAGQNCTYIPNQLTYCCCDHLSEMMLPVSGWGKLYFAMPIATRLKGDFFRIFAGDDNATVKINGVEIAQLAKRGGGQGIGWTEYRAPNREPVEISADKPIAVAQYNTSQNYDGVVSDPFFMMLTPLEQYCEEVLFSTPQDDFASNYLNLICDSAAFAEIEIALGGAQSWTKLKAFGGVGPLRPFPTMIDGVGYAGVTSHIPPGVYRLRGPRPFAAYLYGFSNYDSYGFPVSAITSDLTVVDTMPPGITRMYVDCQGTISGVVTSNREGQGAQSKLSVLDLLPGSSNYRLAVAPTFTPGGSSQTTYTLTPLGANQEAIAVIGVADMAGNITIDTISYDALMLSTATASFDDVKMTEKVIETISFINPSPLREVRLTSFRFRNGTRGFRLANDPGEATIAAEDTLLLDVEFSPVAVGAFSDTLMATDSCGERVIAIVSGRGLQPSSATGNDRSIAAAAAPRIVPNPVTGMDAILHYTLPAAGKVSIRLIDASGKDVRGIVDGEMIGKGEQSLRIDLAGLPAGRYFARILFEGGELTAPVALAR